MDDLKAKGYTPLLYIESDGTQYIDTGFKPTLKTKLYADFKIITTGNDQGIMGVVDDNCCLVYNQTNIYGSFKAGTGESVTVNASSAYYNRHTASIENGVFALDNVEHTFTQLSSYSSGQNVYIFALNYNGVYGATGLRMYAAKIYDNDTLVRDLVPAKNSEGVCGLYDKVNDVFYASATSTNFTGVAMGSNGMPIGYTRCEYIESDGTNYIDTGFSPNQDTKIEMAASIFAFDGDQYLYGAKDSGSTKSYICAFSDSAMTFGYASQFPSEAYIPNSGEKFYITQDKNIGYINGEAVTEATAATFQSPVSLYLCARNNEGTLSKLTKVRIYSCQIYDNGTLIRDYIPCQTDKGVYGLWDDVNKEFVAEVKQEAVAPTYTWSTVEGSTTSEVYSSAFDGVRRIISGNGHSSASRARCTFKGVTSITFSCVYSGENNYDYLTIGNLDSTCTRSTYGMSLKGTSGTIKDITFNCTEDEHYVEFCYSKDGSMTEGDDCGYVYIKSVVAATVAGSNPFTGKWAESKEMKFSLAEWRHRLMVSSFRQKYNLPPQGVYIQDTKNNLYAVDDFPTLIGGLSVVVVDNACKPFGIIPPNDTSDYIYGSSQTAVIGPYRTVYNTAEKALLDYNGKENTQSILDYAENGGVFELAANSAVYLASLYYFTDGENTFRSYMPSVGQCALMQKYIEEINKGFFKLGSLVSLEVLGEVWTSTCAERCYGATETWYDNYVWKFNYNMLVSVDMYQNYNNAKYGYLSVIDIKL